MIQALSSLRRTVFALGSLLLCSCAVMSQPAPLAPAPSTNMNGKALAEKFVRPSNGTAAIVFDEKGQPTVVGRDGQIVQPCQICTPELEKRYGPKCMKALQVQSASAAKMSTPPEAPGTPQICTKLMNTNVLDVKPISAIRHTGSECMTIFFNADGQALAFEFCWD